MPDVPSFALPGLMHIDNPLQDEAAALRQSVYQGEPVTISRQLPDDEGGFESLDGYSAHLRLLWHGREVTARMPMVVDEEADTATLELTTADLEPGDHQYDVCFEKDGVPRWTRRYYLTIRPRITPPGEEDVQLG